MGSWHQLQNIIPLYCILSITLCPLYTRTAQSVCVHVFKGSQHGLELTPVHAKQRPLRLQEAIPFDGLQLFVDAHNGLQRLLDYRSESFMLWSNYKTD